MYYRKGPCATQKRAVGTLIRNRMKQILCIRHHDNHLWCLPAGKAENCESEEEAVCRELQEELKIEAKIRGLQAVYLQDPAFHFHYPSRNWFHFVFLFEDFFKEESVRPCQGEIEEWGFFPENGLPPLFHLHQKWIREMSEKNRKVVL